MSEDNIEFGNSDTSKRNKEVTAIKNEASAIESRTNTDFYKETRSFSSLNAVKEIRKSLELMVVIFPILFPSTLDEISNAISLKVEKVNLFM